MKIEFVATGYDEDCGISTYTTSLEKELDVETNRTELKLRSKNMLHYARKAVEAGRTEADVLHVQHEYGIYGPKSIASWLFFPIIWTLTRIRGVPIVLTLHTAWNKDSVAPPLLTMKQIYVKMNNHLISAISNHLIFLSKNSKEKFEESVVHQSTSIIPHGVQTDIRDFDQPKRVFDYETNEPLVVLPGYVRPQKGYDVLIDLATDLPEVSFLIAGGVQDTSHESYADKIERTAPDNLIMTGVLNEKQFHAAFAAADLVVLPYDSVTQSGILNWCVAYEVPIVASDREYFQDFKNECDGIEIFKTKNEAANLIYDLIEDKTRRTEMEEAMASYRKLNSMDVISSKHVKLYENANRISI